MQKALHLYGAASFLYNAFPSQAKDLKPDKATIMSFFGAIEPAPGETAFGFQPERIPANWTNRETPYTILEIGGEILDQYLAHPVLFGGNVGPDNFDALGEFGPILNGQLGGNGTDISASDVACLLYELIATEAVPDCEFIALFCSPTKFDDDVYQPFLESSTCPSKFLTGSRGN